MPATQENFISNSAIATMNIPLEDIIPTELDSLLAHSGIKNNEKGLQIWSQDMLLHLPKRGLKNNPILILPEDQDKFTAFDWLEQGLRYFNDCKYANAMGAFFKVKSHAHDAEGALKMAAIFMKMQILFDLELWQDATEAANEIITKYDTKRHDDMALMILTNAYIVRAGYYMIFKENDEQAKIAINRAVKLSRNLDIHDMLVADTILLTHLYQIAFYASSQPDVALKVMRHILKIFADNVLPEVRIIRKDIEQYLSAPTRQFA